MCSNFIGTDIKHNLCHGLTEIIKLKVQKDANVKTWEEL